MELKQAIAAAKEIAAEANENCYILYSPVYRRSHDEYGEGDFVVGCKAACAIMFPLSIGKSVIAKVVGVVDPKGIDFVNPFNIEAAKREVIP